MTTTHPSGLPGTPPAAATARATAQVTGYVPPSSRPRRRSWLRRPSPARPLLAVLVVTAVIGAALAHIPSPTRVGDLWVGNLAAPYLVVPALAGALAGGRFLRSLVAGAVGGAGLVLGFYAAPAAVLAGQDSASRWFHTFVLGEPYGTPWLTIAVVVGLVMGPVGYLFRRASGFVLVVLAAALVAGPFLAEVAFHLLASAGGMRTLPVIGAVGWPMTARNELVLSAEAGLGALTHTALVVTRFLPTRAISLG